MVNTGATKIMDIQDFYMEQDNSSLFDMVVDEETKDFKSVAGLETAINVQLFLDQRVSREERANTQDRRGWIGDIINRESGYQIGSLLHLQEQGRDTPVDNNETAALAKLALEYLVTIGATKTITAEAVGKNIEGVIVNSNNDTSRYSKLWRATNAS
jgi:phage gp46-like protein